MAHAASHTRKNRFAVVLACLALAFAVVVAVSAALMEPAVASHDVDNSTIGIGDEQNTASDEDVQESAGRLTTNARVSGASLATSASRSITVNDPDPVIVISAYDTSNPNTAAAAQELGTTTPLPTAPHILPTEEDGWMVGQASAYSYSDNDDGKGNFGTSATASGVPLSDYGLTVAVPQSQSYLLGRAVAIRYGETIVVATVTDTGGFAGYGRALDLAPGTWRALGAQAVGDWGVRQVYYTFL